MSTFNIVPIFLKLESIDKLKNALKPITSNEAPTYRSSLEPVLNAYLWHRCL